MTDLSAVMNDADLQSEVRGWLDANWTPEARAALQVPAGRTAWLERVLAAGWAVPRWPVDYQGRNLSEEQAEIVVAAFEGVGAPGTGQDTSNLWANTLLATGQEALKRELLPKLLTDAVDMCLLYSEPGAGSDLAAVRTRADRERDTWIVTGQKVWTSGAAIADYGLLLARTDWDVPKHKGLSFFILPMKQAGVDVRLIHQITGDAHFSEVFIDAAVVPALNLLGEENGGWRVLQTALAYERLVMGEGIGERRQGSCEDNSVDLIALARTAECLGNPLIRQDIARAIGYRRLNKLNITRAKAEMEQGSTSSIMSMSKLAMSRILHEDARVMTAILGTASILDGSDHPAASDINYRTANAYMTSIGGGTDQIQRNIIAERVLGLPREIEVDRDRPFRESRAVTE